MPWLANEADLTVTLSREYNECPNMIELSESEVEMVAGGRTVGNITVQNNINVNPQAAIGIAVLSPYARVTLTTTHLHYN